MEHPKPTNIPQKSMASMRRANLCTVPYEQHVDKGLIEARRYYAEMVGVRRGWMAERE